MRNVVAHTTGHALGVGHPRGVLVSVVGVGGAGKSSAIKAASEVLERQKLRVTTFHSRTEFAGLAENVLAATGEPLTLDERRVLMAFERVRELCYELDPVRTAFDVVITDRYWHCLLARSLADGVTPRAASLIARLGGLAPQPDGIIWLDIDPLASVERIADRGGLRPDLRYGERLRAAYRKLAREYRFHRVEAAQPHDAVRDAIVDRALALLEPARVTSVEVV